MENSKVRMPVVAGQFYPGTAAELTKQIESFVDKKVKKRDCIGCILPHAGYIYSGAVAAKTLSRVIVKERAVLLGPNHTGCGAPFSIMTSGVWRTPLGEVKIDEELAAGICEKSTRLESDAIAHLEEHALEVELPLLQFFKRELRIVPISFRSQDLDALKQTGRAIGEAIKGCGSKDSIIIVASSDMTHYEPQQEAEKKDKEAIEAVLDLNEDLLMDKVTSLNISMCGIAPVIALLSAAKVLGAERGELIEYRTSGDATGDKSSVVGYAGITIT
ncbi:AmmeMemoRadiSam system protein B [Candidatus Omnitrophota bacterium]